MNVTVDLLNEGSVWFPLKLVELPVPMDLKSVVKPQLHIKKKFIKNFFRMFLVSAECVFYSQSDFRKRR